MGRNKKEREPIVEDREIVEDTIEEIKVETTVEPIQIKEPEPSLPEVPFKVFSPLSGISWDQLAGFEYWSKSLGKKLLTIPGWKKLYAEYCMRPVK